MSSEVNGASDDGSIVVGSLDDTTNATGRTYPYQPNTGGCPGAVRQPPGRGRAAPSAHRWRTTIVGFPTTGIRGIQDFQAIRWTKETGPVDFQGQPNALAANLPLNFTLTLAMSLGDDGHLNRGWDYIERIALFQEP